MGALTVGEILAATGGRMIFGNSTEAVFTGVSIDSRSIAEGELFVALKGRNFDGHDFLRDAMTRGRGAVVSEPPVAPVKGRAVIYVKNTLKALQDIARSMRAKRRLTVIGVTGTNGKTTTKELVASILGMRHSVMKTLGNLNNQIGLPLSLTRLRDTDEFAILEMGASFRGDIRELCGIAAPEYGVITNIGPGHLEGFGNIEKVRDTKLELYDAVATIAVNADDALLMEGVRGKKGSAAAPRILSFGVSDQADVRACDITLEERRSVFTLCIGDGQARVAMNVPGGFNISNALAAAAICHALGAGLGEIREGVEAFRGVPMRHEVRELFGATVISDVYNANPASMEEAIKELARTGKERTVAVLGDMLELGAYAEDAHRKLGRWMSGLHVDALIAVGEMMAKTAEEFSASRRGGSSAAGNGAEMRTLAHVVTVSDAREARKALLGFCREGDTVLVKGSRGMHMERVLEENGAVPPLSPKEERKNGAREVGNAL
ncbi:MAG: UDP-N-acetylmuramoyl-tripeptide--D-alanyl-D-alanine ligase [Nitrospirae bacterium]|nr:UDP-N-acetylmuramoyl-tripeptide--D-alanyl-D-alanine ligase [Nitrospirota bacterium]